ncbi:hypothetical protein FRACYDRAFT_181523 [Fragilariopsis cylindrus CCMP1102]|uniref:HCP-like protein n=1 Tax=Fragilariopsis cylindrus CCMP1102 TaxID=635003 RepID=A0A1E7FNR0_9STRA|nr:hypothetical protein FRACYDRAFT_181523 [Fragilariopsis cylindrus CCMP1102]|eukprot:OEU19800.1 hypothetical protein FRACYDRAFT_181523 [Fragilariopsis cylindrus CCMP1102]
MVRKSSEYRSSSFSPSNNNTSDDAYYFYPRLALERAANAGHPMAQHYLANAHSSGIWPVPAVGDGGGGGSGEDFESSSQSTSAASSLVEELHVFDEWNPPAREDHPQFNKAFLLWHMAALGGNIESAMTLAYRLDDGEDTSLSKCEEVLPYYQAAADGIIDQLETSIHSRAKVVPSMDKHTLAQVHMHGGTSSQLDWNNKPDESKEALQFYHLKATTKQTNKKKTASEQTEGIDISAAYTLAHLYHYGVRGVEQNLTKSLQYYEIAGSHSHWESAGHACIFHLWGIGGNQNAKEALTFCQLGAPSGYEGCRQRYERASVLSKKKTGETISQCDENSLNGLGLMHLMGIQGGVLKVDLSMAEKYFTLAKELGSMDAYYNLAMMWLGWKTHFKTVDELADNGFSGFESAENELPIPGKMKKESSDKYNAIKMLGVAAKQGHVQSKHRLGMIYADGLNLTTSVIKYNFVKKDCQTAKEHFKWIVKNASPTRSNRLKSAYKEYIAGNLEVSVRNYLAAAEIGSTVGQVNAAFLLEHGVCLGLSAVDCAKASVRLWKAAAARGNPEACLRVGDFYYYGRLRGNKLHTGPFGWIQYILYPENHLPSIFKQLGSKVLKIAVNLLGQGNGQFEETVESSSSSGTCDAEEGTCHDDDHDKGNENDHDHDYFEEDLHTAAHYYQVAGEKHLSARANFNLGFMHQWGLGLKQDFPLAKRHYDLALSRNYREAEIAVQIALMAMNSHEFIIRWKVVLEEWWYQRETTSTTISGKDSSPSPTAPVPKTTGNKKSREKVILSHIFDGTSLIILILFLLIFAIQIMMSFIGRPQR